MRLAGLPVFQKPTRTAGQCWKHARQTKQWSSGIVRQWSTPVAQDLAKAIATTGPISIASYMRHCLTSSTESYYTRTLGADRDQFGVKGDFVTSPEISQIFGELVSVWFISEWLAQGRPAGVNLIELGPGRGTLMKDVLRGLQMSRQMASVIDTVYLVEASPALRRAQHQLLCEPSSLLKETEQGFEATSKQLPGVKIVWLDSLDLVPKGTGKTPFIIAHEFFDALPIHAFRNVPKPSSRIITDISHKPREEKSTATTQTEWRELLVNVTNPIALRKAQTGHPQPEFELCTAAQPTPHSKLLPSLSPRYEALQAIADSIIEISPASRTLASSIAQLIGGVESGSENLREQQPPTGSALIVDYGPSASIPINSLRGIQNHRLVSPYSEPGQVDLSADVDFGALVEAALANSKLVEVYGPVDQAQWLKVMGGQERCNALVDSAMKSDTTYSRSAAQSRSENKNIKLNEAAQRIQSGWNRITDLGPNGMGKLYKFLSIVPRSGGMRRPLGFGGNLLGST